MAASITARVQKRREALRMAGLRPIQLWVPDTRRPSFAEECHLQSESLGGDNQESEVLDWIGVVSNVEGWE